MSTVSKVLPLSQGAEKLAKIKKAAGGTAIAGIFCLTDFLSVPGAFKLDYNIKGEKIEGTNWKSGFKEIGKSAVKCASFIAAPAIIGGLAAGAGIIVAGLAAAASFGSSFAISSILEELLPSEQKLVADACKEKGINIETNGILA